jgi:pyruvate formate lyase activating enzyme
MGMDTPRQSLADLLDRMTVQGELYERRPDGKVVCYACGHRCTVFRDKRGICKVRFNDNGVLKVPWGYVAALQCDPTEKKPFNHVLPGSLTLTFGMLGCDFHCSYCQNFVTSQALRDPAAGVEPVEVTAQQMAQLALRHGARLVGSSYNEPLITSEWALTIFKEAKVAGLRTCYISNGNATPEVLQYLRPWTDCYKIDLKAFNDKNYRFLGGRLESVTNTIKMVHAMGFWTEVVTLVIPGYNDHDDELQAAAEFIASVSPFIPWHVTAFHKDYKMTDPDNTPPESLVRAAKIGEAAGLKYVYAGNLPGRVGKYEHTFCYHCGTLLVERFGYLILQNRLTPAGGRCPDCGTVIPGIWH